MLCPCADQESIKNDQFRGHTPRDCLQCLACIRPETAARWCDQLAGSQTPLLRRLGVHTMSVRTDLSECEKLDWLFANVHLHDDAAYQELSRLMREIYPQADPERRERTIETILAFRLPDVEHHPEGLPTARYQFEWLRCLHDADPGCVLATQALDDVTGRFPEFRSRERSDPRHQWTIEELLSRPARDSLDELLSFRQESALWPDRHDLITTVTHAATREFHWGADLADALAGRERWDADLWISLFRTWREGKLTEEQVTRVFGYLGEVALLVAHTARVADLLLAWLEDADAPITAELLGVCRICLSAAQ